MQQHDRVYVESFGNFPSDLFWDDVHSGILSKVKALCHSNFSSKIVIFRSMSFSSDSDAAASLMNRKVKAAESSYNTLGREALTSTIALSPRMQTTKFEA